MKTSQFDRRTAVTFGAMGAVGAALGIRAGMAQDDEAEEAGVAAGATPGASPSASPGASPAAGGDRVTVIGIDIAYEPEEFSIPADTDVEIHFVNEGMLEHDFNIEDTDFGTEILPGGGNEEETITVNLPAGEYVYFCSVPGHRQAGMEGTLTVE